MSSQAELSRIQSYQYPAAHLGHLTPAQQSALDEFKQQCEKEGYYKPAGEGETETPSHDDETLLRFLRARRFNSNHAFEQFKHTEDWRAENKLPELYETIDVEEYEETRRLVAPLNSKTVSKYERSIAMKGNPAATDSRKAPPKMLRLFALYENLTGFVMPWCTAIEDRPHPETPISQSNNIVDISRVGLKQFWNLKNHMQDASTLATAYYPETLDRIFIIGAPAFFPTVWGWIKRWFDPITVSKIFILSSSNMKSTLEQYIDPANIPKKYGGELDFSFGDKPVIEPALNSPLQWNADGAGEQREAHTMPPGPVRWEEGPNGEMVAVAVGTEDGKPRRRVVATLPMPYRSTLQPGVNTEIDASMELPSGVGTDTQPKDDEIGDDYVMLTNGDSERSGDTTPATPASPPSGASADEQKPVRRPAEGAEAQSSLAKQAVDTADAVASGAAATAATVTDKADKAVGAGEKKPEEKTTEKTEENKAA